MDQKLQIGGSELGWPATLSADAGIQDREAVGRWEAGDGRLTTTPEPEKLRTLGIQSRRSPGPYRAEEDLVVPPPPQTTSYSHCPRCGDRLFRGTGWVCVACPWP